MEDTLREASIYKIEIFDNVLILVLMEDTLRVTLAVAVALYVLSLNPCFNGRYSQRCEDERESVQDAVLILVLMEDTLRVQRLITKQ